MPRAEGLQPRFISEYNYAALQVGRVMCPWGTCTVHAMMISLFLSLLYSGQSRMMRDICSKSWLVTLRVDMLLVLHPCAFSWSSHSCSLCQRMKGFLPFHDCVLVTECHVSATGDCCQANLPYAILVSSRLAIWSLHLLVIPLGADEKWLVVLKVRICGLSGDKPGVNCESPKHFWCGRSDRTMLYLTALKGCLTDLCAGSSANHLPGVLPSIPRRPGIAKRETRNSPKTPGWRLLAKLSSAHSKTSRYSVGISHVSGYQIFRDIRHFKLLMS